MAWVTDSKSKVDNMLNHRLLSQAQACALAVAAAAIAGLFAGLGFWTWACVPAGFALYLGWEVDRRSREIRGALAQLRSAVAQLPEGALPGLSTAPGVELTLLAGALEEMNNRVRELLNGLEHDRDRLQAVFTSMRDAVIALGSSGWVALINPVAERLFEVSADEVVGHSVLEVIRHHKLAGAMQKAMDTGHPTTFEFETFDVPPRHFQAEVASVHTTRGKLSGAVAVLHDVTELRRLERVRSEFVANVSHELRTPITSIKGFLETLLDGAMSEPDTCRYFLTILAEEADRLAHLVNDLLELSHLEEDTAPLVPELLDARTEAERAIELVAPMAQEKNIGIALRLPEDLRVRADREMLRQALLNLLDNAIKYTPAKGQVWIEGAESASGNMVQLTVGDTGPGIPSEHLGRIFERFYRVDKARSRAIGGTGLGLSIVRHIVERHNGKVWAESALGHGSKFTMAFPKTK